MKCKRNANIQFSPNSLDGIEKGQVFTPKYLADWVAHLLAEKLPPHQSTTILDPACGNGELLVSVAPLLQNAKLIGVDIDPAALSSAQDRTPNNCQFYLGDMLSRSCPTPFLSKGTYKPMPKKVDAIIANPPWGADTFKSKSELQSTGFTLASGQYDSWCLFVELSLALLKRKGRAAFILPDAIFLPEHEATRRLLVNNYSIELIARLGEGIFKGIHRGTVVVVVQNIKPTTNHLIDVFRLSKSERRTIAYDKDSLTTSQRSLSHSVPQSRFLKNQLTRWDIDVNSNERKTIEKIESCSGNWADLLIWGRGVEISKKGSVRCCENCSFVIPAPIKPREIICRRCGLASYSETMPLRHVISKLNNSKEGFTPFVAGEDIGRYKLTSSRQIAMNIDGLNYKNIAIYSKERILIRKTGVGLKATLTKIKAISNQVVFHFIPKPEIEDWNFYLPYVLGVLSSRIIFAYHLKKSGENEWRSHPYVTPTILATLPIPVPEKGKSTWTQAHAVADAVRYHLETGGVEKESDLRIERLVAGIFRLSTRDIAWTKKVISSAQNLEPMKSLNNFDETSVFAELVN